MYFALELALMDAARTQRIFFSSEVCNIFLLQFENKSNRTLGARCKGLAFKIWPIQFMAYVELSDFIEFRFLQFSVQKISFRNVYRCKME